MRVLRLVCGLLVMALAGVAAEQALDDADALPIPTVSTTTIPKVTVPITTTVPLPVTTPKLPTTTTSAPSTRVTTTASTVTSSASSAVSTVSGTVTSTASGSTSSASKTASKTASGSLPSGSSSGSTSGSGSGSGSSSGSSSGSYSSSSSSRAGGAPNGSGASGRQSPAGSRNGVAHLESKRTWIGTTGPKKRRTTLLTFTLPSRARVTFFVNQLWPKCRSIGRFAVRGRAGLNRVRFTGRVGGRQLAPGTYRLSAKTRRGRVVQRIILVVVSGGAPTREEIEAARAANACGNGAAAGTTGSTTGTPTPSTGASAASPIAASTLRVSEPADEEQVSAGPFPAQPNVDSGVLGTSVEETVRTIRPFLVALLAAAIVLLAVAALPPAAVADRRVNDILARHRLEIAGIGAAALVATAVAFLLV